MKFHGTKNIFWVGCVEERSDAEAIDGHKLGRVRVRILGFHSPEKETDDASGEGIATENLPWAYPIAPITTGVNGIGDSPTGIVEGTWVMGMSMDGPAMQDLYILGVLPGAATERPTPDKGFADPNDKYPMDEWLGESDISRLARNEKTSETFLPDKRNEVERGIRKANGGIWNEPTTPYAAEYPFNHVKQTESGHIQEFDDTEGAERIHLRHKDGSFIEYHPGGDKVTKVYGDGFEIHLKDRNMLVKGDLNITVKGDAKILAQRNAYIEADQDIKLKAKNKISLWSMKGIDIKTLGKITVFGLFGVNVTAALGPAAMASPLNSGTSVAKAVG